VTFGQKLQAGSAGHAGLSQSLMLVAHAMGWKIDRLVEHAEPVVAAARIVTTHFTVATGETCGIHQSCVGIVGGQEKITLDLQMYLKAPNPHDAIVICGRPSLNLMLHGGVAGDDATVAALVNVIPRLLASAPGLRLLTELPSPAWSNPVAWSGAA
jgi:hypothetical protein